MLYLRRRQSGQRDASPNFFREDEETLAGFDGKSLTRLKESKLGQEYRREEAEEKPHL